MVAFLDPFFSIKNGWNREHSPCLKKILFFTELFHELKRIIFGKTIKKDVTQLDRT